MPPKGFPTVQLDMFVAENIGLYKLDVLSRMASATLKNAFGW
ncbi:MAG TPA: hypothetical protein VLI68_03395 [Hanamia sp.]|jgi:hypothetical protein|nr:hypothetical protein [Hanamia sp.]